MSLSTLPSPTDEPLPSPTDEPLPSPTDEPLPLAAPVLDVVVPVYNEETDLEPCVRRLHAYLTAEFPYPFRITVADNASTDATPDMARILAESLPEVASVRLAEKGRGRADRKSTRLNSSHANISDAVF